MRRIEPREVRNSCATSAAFLHRGVRGARGLSRFGNSSRRSINAGDRSIVRCVWRDRRNRRDYENEDAAMPGWCAMEVRGREPA
jgi:hypothetical protein